MTTPESLNRSEAHRRLLALGMPADLADDCLDHEQVRYANASNYPGAWPILEAYRRHCVAHEGIVERAIRLDREATARACRPDLTPAEEAEIIASAPGQIGPGQTPIGRPPSTIAAALLRASRAAPAPASALPIDHPGVRDALRALAVAMCATQARDPEQKAQLQRGAEAYDALRYVLGDRDPAAEDAIPPVRFPGDVSIPRAILERLAKAAASDPDAREARWAAERILQQADLAAEPARTDPEAARRLAERHFLIIGPALGEVIGCTSSRGMPSPREVGEPGATFREVSKEACPLCAVVGGAK